MKVAQFRGTGKYGCVLTIARDDENDLARPIEGYVRITEWLDVTFVPLSHEAVVVGELAVLDSERAEIVQDFAEKLKAIDDRKAELLAITHITEDA